MGYTSSLGWTPQHTISKSGEDITSAFRDRLVSLQITSAEGGGDADSCDITLDDRDWLIGLPAIGEGSATVDVALGYVESGMYHQGSFEINEAELSFAPKTMLLHGTSVGLNSAIKSPLITSYDNKTVGQIVGSIAQAAGVSAVIAPALEGLTVEYLNQHGGSGHLLTQLERQFDATAKFSDGKLAFLQRGQGTTASEQSSGNVVLDGTDIADLKLKLTKIPGFSTVRASYWDKDQHKLVWLKSGVAGSAGSTAPFMLKRSYSTQVEAQAAADAQMRTLNRMNTVGQLTMARGDPSIRGSQKITITSTRDGIDGTFIVSRASHSLSKDSGIVTSLAFYNEDGGEEGEGGSSE